MIIFRILFLVLASYMTYYSYQRSKQSGEWAWSRFFILIGAIAVFAIGFMIPLFNSDLMDTHLDLAFGIFVAGAFSFVGIIYYFFTKYPVKTRQGTGNQLNPALTTSVSDPIQPRPSNSHNIQNSPLILLSLTLFIATQAVSGSAQITSDSTPAQQQAALDKACNSGALTQEQCTQFRAKLAAMSSSQPNRQMPQGGPSGGQGNLYKDPQGRYSLNVPDGWNTASDNGNLQLSTGQSWAMFLTGGGSVPADVNHDIVKQIQAQFTDFKLLNEGDTQVGGHPSHGTNATGINPKGGRVSVLVLSINAGSGHFLTIVSSSPNDQAKTINSIVMQMANTIRFGGE